MDKCNACVSFPSKHQLVWICGNKNCWISCVCIFHAFTENNTGCCALCSLLGSCISFVMKSVEGANFKLISPTQRTPISLDAKRAETSAKISADNAALHLQLIMRTRLLGCCCSIALVWIALSCSALLCFHEFNSVQYLVLPCSFLFSPLHALFYFCLHTVNIWTVLCGSRLA